MNFTSLRVLNGIWMDRMGSGLACERSVLHANELHKIMRNLVEMIQNLNVDGNVTKSLIMPTTSTPLTSLRVPLNAGKYPEPCDSIQHKII